MLVRHYYSITVISLCAWRHSLVSTPFPSSTVLSYWQMVSTLSPCHNLFNFHWFNHDNCNPGIFVKYDVFDISMERGRYRTIAASRERGEMDHINILLSGAASVCRAGLWAPAPHDDFHLSAIQVQEVQEVQERRFLVLKFKFFYIWHSDILTCSSEITCLCDDIGKGNSKYIIDSDEESGKS